MHRAGAPPGAFDLLKFGLVFLLLLIVLLIVLGQVDVGDVDVDFNHFQAGGMLD